MPIPAGKDHLIRTACFLLFFCLLFAGCKGSVSTPIQKILENPRHYNGKPVMISGEVTKVLSLLVIKYFVVKDGTGELTVVTKKPLPQKGANITVRGTIEEAFSIGDRQLIVMMETGGQD